MALKEEAAAILDEQAFGWEEAPQGVLRSRTFPVSLLLSGVGKVHAARAATLLAADCSLLCTLGTSGGLSKEKVGSLYLCEKAVEYDMDAAGLGYPPGVTPFAPTRDPALGALGDAGRDLVRRALAEAGLRAERGLLASGDRFLADAAQARAVRELFGADLVDMESAAVAKVAGLSGLDFFALRWISDNADHSAAEDWRVQVERSAPVFSRFLLALCTLHNATAEN